MSAVSPSHLRLIRDEAETPYDAPSGHRTMIDDDVVEEVLRQCGLAAMGLYTYLERKANRDGQCWPSMHEMAEVAGCTDRYIRELINERLVPAGFVHRSEKRNRFGRTEGVIYTLPYHRSPSKTGEELPPERGEERPPEPKSQTSSAKVDTEYLGVDTSSSPRADAREGNATEPEKDVTPPASEPEGGALMDRFNRWYATYPRKAGKGAARKAWERLKPDEATTERMIAAVEAQKRSPQWTKDGGQFIPHPSTWLNQERWDDEAAPPATPGVKPPVWFDPSRKIDPGTLTPAQREELAVYRRRQRGIHFQF